MLTIVLPVLNEQIILRENALRLWSFCRDNLKEEWQIIISDSASTDKTPFIGHALAENYLEIKYFRQEIIGKGAAVLGAWQSFPADIYIFMDADLAADLKFLPALVSAVKNKADIAVGSRFQIGASSSRPWLRRLTSRGLRLVLKIFFHLKAKDAPCGFKAINQKTLATVIPRIKNQTWFFDTELLILAEQQGLNIKEIPIIWQDGLNPARRSTIRLFAVIKDYLKNIFSLLNR
ncbi:hypothetical protein A3E04_00090 [Candidatus Kuenenbacteria bacterium RIFCSPHIGHO2_12_FULL_42_14]|uniref:Glycosyltransferase 2-like domain-containing protein n=1 Tax=Candidatus Kuenenbacteria bacterium RIFCSPHIGHO2_12_FULL_42_14 TaxID=1798563 RepID=A0A1F6GKR0_9BACT|nr:MAG: hypothetical protein A3C68_00060 [Candidatus Kuenenbacteria bacterium RIFCSPHIGHO2_02_FULL_42_29]OGG98704.1 MAG: hypothetical protein A3E04_00090 [Candidatus Kuenenbacteria bacterium RIFCSPHIGHO2_12_FULL_42_14]